MSFQGEMPILSSVSVGNPTRRRVVWSGLDDVGLTFFPVARSRGVDEVNDRGRGSHEQENGGQSMYVGIGIGALVE